jgi:hypothetical protein
MAGLRMSQGPRLKQTHGLVQRLEAPSPEEAVTGFAGMGVAHRILRRNQAAGLLIGGVAKELWRLTTNTDLRARVDEHKDVDVLVLSHDCERHPEKWQGGVDWWVTHSPEERPCNGSSVGIIWSARLLRPLAPGLYLCPRSILAESVVEEGSQFPGRTVVSHRFKAEPSSNWYPVPSYGTLEVDWLTAEAPISNFPCR